MTNKLLSNKYTSFNEYVRDLNACKDKLTIYIVSKDNIGRNLSESTAELLLKLGVKINLSGRALGRRSWRGYIAIIEEGILVFEEISAAAERMRHEYNDFVANSTVWKDGGCEDASLENNRVNYCANFRGLNFSIFDKNGDFISACSYDAYSNSPVFRDLTDQIRKRIEFEKIINKKISLTLPELPLSRPLDPWGETAVIFGGNADESLCKKYNFKSSSLHGGVVISSSKLHEKEGYTFAFNGCAFSHNEAGERVFLMGGEDVVREVGDVEKLRHELGEFELLIAKEDFLELSTDYFGLSKWFYYHKNGIFAAATSFHLLVLVLKGAGIQLELNTGLISQYFARYNWLTAHLYSYDTFIKDIHYCPVDRDICYKVSEDSLLLQNTPFFDEQKDVRDFCIQKYTEYLNKAKDELLGVMKAISSHPKINHVIMDLTDGLDTRTNVAIATLLPERLKKKVRFRSINPQEKAVSNLGLDADFRTACGIANLTGIKFIDIKRNSKVLDFRCSPISKHLGTIFKDKAAWGRADVTIYPNTIQLTGGNGESCMASGSYGTFYHSTLEEGFDKWYTPRRKPSNKLLKEVQDRHKDEISKILTMLPSMNFHDKLDLHYTHFRNSFHFSSKHEPQLKFSPIQSIFAYRAKKLMQKKKGYPFFFTQHELLTLINPEVADFPYLSDKQNDRFEIFEKERRLFHALKQSPDYSSECYHHCYSKRDQDFLPNKRAYNQLRSEARKQVSDIKLYDDYNVFVFLLQEVINIIPCIKSIADSLKHDYHQSGTNKIHIINRLLHIYYLNSMIELE